MDIIKYDRTKTQYKAEEIVVKLSGSTVDHKVSLKTRLPDKNHSNSQAYITMSTTIGRSIGYWMTDEELDELILALMYIKKVRSEH